MTMAHNENDPLRLFIILVTRWGFTPLVEAHRFRHTELVTQLMEIIRERHPESLQSCTRLLDKMTQKEKIRKASLIEREISTE